MNVVVTVSHDAVKIVNAKYDCQIVMVAPEWKVHCFNPKQKLEWVGPIDIFKGGLLCSPFANTEADPDELKFGGNGKMRGFGYSLYFDPECPLSQTCGADEIAVAKPVAYLLCRFFGVPLIPKVPLHSSLYLGKRAPGEPPSKKTGFDELADDKRTGAVTMLSTSSWKKSPYCAADFKLPRGYTHVGTPAEVIYTGDRNSGLIDMIDGVGFSGPARVAPDRVNPAKRHYKKLQP